MIVLRENDILLFQGDSITHGGRGLSKTDMNHIIGHGYQSILASKIGFENIDRLPTIYNRGVSGDTIGKMFARWNEDVISLKPTVLSILIGINDCLSAESLNIDLQTELFDKTYRLLLDYTFKMLPDVKLIIGEPFAFNSPQSYVDKNEREICEKRIGNCKILSELTKKISEDYNALFVPYWDELKRYTDELPTDSIIWDGIHPTYIGHEIMARKWYDTVDKSCIFKL